jgi:hypothetical protein
MCVIYFTQIRKLSAIILLNTFSILLSILFARLWWYKYKCHRSSVHFFKSVFFLLLGKFYWSIFKFKFYILSFLTLLLSWSSEIFYSTDYIFQLYNFHFYNFYFLAVPFYFFIYFMKINTCLLKWVWWWTPVIPIPGRWGKKIKSSQPKLYSKALSQKDTHTEKTCLLQ